MKPTVYMMLGLPGFGKTTFSKNLQAQLTLKRFAIDEEYSKLGGNLTSYQWDKKVAKKAGAQIRAQTKYLVANGESVILDLCPWVKESREKYRRFIDSIGATCHIYYFEVNKDELLRRLAARNISKEEAYVVSPKMLEEFIEEFDKPIGEEVELIKA